MTINKHDNNHKAIMDEKESFNVIDKRGLPKEEAVKEEPAKVATEKKAETDATEQAQSIKLDFTSFVMSLAHQTVVLLGEAPNPETGQVATNIEGARQTIDIIGILEEKTKGNLTDSEKNLLDEALTGLRMAYVKKSKEA